MSPGHETTSTAAIPVRKARESDPQRSRLRWLVVVGAGLVLMLLVRGLIAQSFYIPSSSMEPTLQPADRILVYWPLDRVGILAAPDPMKGIPARALVERHR